MSTKSVQLPDIGEGVTEGELVQWLVQVGDTVEDDQPVAEIMTDKATVEVPTPFAGVVKELKAQEGDVIPIETEILVLEVTGAAQAEEPKKEEPKKQEASAPAQKATPQPASAGAQATQTIHPPVAEVNVLATPSTRRLAREMSVNINEINGSGLAGRVTREDILSAKPSAAPSVNGHAQPAVAPQFKTPAPLPVDSAEREERVALRGIRRKIAENMQMTKQIVPHFTLMDECNVTELVKLRTQAKSAGEKHGIKITYLPFVMKSLIATIKEFPMFNASIDDQAQEIVYKNYFNIGFAADTPNGLVVPVIKDADRKSILQISAEIMDLAGRAREGKLKPDEMKGATITVTNIGSVGGNYATPIINHPEVAILGMYKIVDKPIMKNGKFRAAKVMNYTVTADHRLIDGAVAANFLNAFMKRLENPSHLMLEMI